MRMSAKYFEISHGGFIVIELYEASPLVKLIIIFASYRVIILFFLVGR